jgi:hypothetical protein
MSEIDERENVIEVVEIPPREVSLREYINYTTVKIDVSNFAGYSIDRVENAKPHSTLASPLTVRANFTKTYPTIVSALISKGITPIEASKAALANTIATSGFRADVATQQTVANHLTRINTVNDPHNYSLQAKAIMSNLEAAHSKAFAHTIAQACAAASVSIGFTSIEVKPINNKIEVIANNGKGVYLVSEVRVDEKTKRVDCATETVGISDGSCSEIIRQFNDELKRMGVKYDSNKLTHTGGKPQMPYSKVIDQSLKEKALKRTRGLNSPNRNSITNKP